MRRLSWLALALLLAPPPPASSQPAQSSPASGEAAPWHVSFIDGPAAITRDGLTEDLVDRQPLVEGDRLRTRPGRVELRAADGALLELDRDTIVDIVGPTAVRLVEGRVRVVTDMASGAPRAQWQILSTVASIRLQEAGEFDLMLSGPSGEPRAILSVLRGHALVEALRGTLDVPTGARAAVRDLEVPRLVNEPFDWQDPFSLWVAGRLETWTPTTSAGYLPEDLNGYSGTLDEYGTWEPYRDGGVNAHVWFPRVEVGWSPYTTGRWARVGRYGWTWIGVDPWAWPTHHYGRWGYTSVGRWYWIPGPVWGPAWVEWAIGPGYVGWCPLGWNNRPVFSFNMYLGFGGDWGRGGYHRPGYGSWTFLESQRFHRGDRVSHHALDVRRLPQDQRGAFVTQRTPPPSRRPGYAIPRPGAGDQAYPRAGEWRGFNGTGTNRGAASPDSRAGQSGSPPEWRNRAGASVPRTGLGVREGGATGRRSEPDTAGRDLGSVAPPRNPYGGRGDTGRYLPQAPRQPQAVEREGAPPSRPGPSSYDRPTRPAPDSWQRSPGAAPQGDTRGGAGLRAYPRGGDSGGRNRGEAPQSRPRTPQVGAPGGGSGPPPSRGQGSSAGSSRGAAPRAPRSRP